MKQLKLFLLAIRIESLWHKIKQNRKRMEKLLHQKEALTSERLIRLDKETAVLGFRAKELEKRYHTWMSFECDTLKMP